VIVIVFRSKVKNAVSIDFGGRSATFVAHRLVSNTKFLNVHNLSSY
jgi:hypothetical protein